ncbi:MAG: hypothetical protein BWY85_02193 [Firmicutes bacterium ADurb.Bin506]|nr:MAG: hypothetical protein BWY85_02193 [Firmicutes bacterium ADurb.Bin506]
MGSILNRAEGSHDTDVESQTEGEADSLCRGGDAHVEDALDQIEIEPEATKAINADGSVPRPDVPDKHDGAQDPRQGCGQRCAGHSHGGRTEVAVYENVVAYDVGNVEGRVHLHGEPRVAGTSECRRQDHVDDKHEEAWHENAHVSYAPGDYLRRCAHEPYQSWSFDVADGRHHGSYGHRHEQRLRGDAVGPGTILCAYEPGNQRCRPYADAHEHSLSDVEGLSRQPHCGHSFCPQAPNHDHVGHLRDCLQYLIDDHRHGQPKHSPARSPAVTHHVVDARVGRHHAGRGPGPTAIRSSHCHPLSAIQYQSAAALMRGPPLPQSCSCAQTRSRLRAPGQIPAPSSRTFRRSWR